MQGETQPKSADMPAAIYDPGEIGREFHNKGDRFNISVANIFAWIFPILMVAICAQVVLRQLGHNQAWLDDLQWWLYGASALIGVSYAVTTDSHVRVDIFYDNYDKKRKARIDVFALVWCFLPFTILIWDVTLGYAVASVVADEGSSSPNGLHNLWLLKVFVNVAFLLICVATWFAYVRRLRVVAKPTLGRQLLWAFPSTMFIVNLWVYYTLYIWHWIKLPEGENTRQITRAPIFDEFDFGPWELRYTIVITLVLTIFIIALALLRDRRGAK